MRMARQAAVGMAMLVVAILAMGAGEPAATQKAENTARATAERVITKVLAVLRDKSLTKSQRGAEVEKIASDNMDFQTLGRLSLGAPWKGLSDEKKKEYVEEFRKYVINTYRHTTDQYTDEDMKITGERTEADKDVVITTQILGTQDNGSRGEVAKVDYRVRNRDGQWKIIDVSIDGVSLVANFRSQFQEIVAGGNIDKLIKTMRDKNAASDKNK